MDKEFDLSEVSTKELVEELIKREGVFTNYAEPYEPYSVKTGDGQIDDEGPAIILTVID
jgi:hypothetical protein